jgi:hypothetical protein
VDHHDTSISITIPKAVFIIGVARPAEGAKLPDLACVRLRLEPTTYSLIRHGPIPLTAAGQFKIENVSMREYRLRVSDIPYTHYLQEVRYNGIPVPDRVFTLNNGAPEHAMELIFDDRPAAIAGSVKVDGKPVPQAHVVLAPLPLPEGGEFFAAMRSATADDNGNFALVAIPPGEYRLFALPVDSRNQLHRPGEKERLTSDAEKITVSRGQTRVANLTLAK